MLGDTAHLRETLARLDDTGLHVLDVELIILRPDYRERDVRGAGCGATAGRPLRTGARLRHRPRPVGRQVQPGLRRGRGPRYPPGPGVHEIQRGPDVAGGRSGRPAIRPPGGVGAGRRPAPAALRWLPRPNSQMSRRSCCRTANCATGRGTRCGRTDDDARIESRTSRLLPGDGDLPLHDLIAALPAGSALSVEAPVAALRELPAAERAEHAFTAATRLLRTH